NTPADNVAHSGETLTGLPPAPPIWSGLEGRTRHLLAASLWRVVATLPLPIPVLKPWVRGQSLAPHKLARPSVLPLAPTIPKNSRPVKRQGGLVKQGGTASTVRL